MRKRLIAIGSMLGVLVLEVGIWQANTTVSLTGLGRLAIDEVREVVERKLGLQNHWFNLDPDPLVVRRLAWPAASAYVDDADRRCYVHGFSAGFKTGLTTPDSTVMRGGAPQEIDVIAFNAGRAAVLSGSGAARKITLRDYGYQFVTVTGVVSVGFEQAHFTPLTGNEVWWLSVISRELYAPLRREKNGDEWRKGDDRPVVATVKGYLSPQRKGWGGYGHMGGYPHEIIVTEVVETHRAEPRAAR